MTDLLQASSPEDGQWQEEVTYRLNNIAAAALAGQAGVAGAGQEVIPVYAIDEMGTDQSLTLGSREFVYFDTVDAGTDPDVPQPAGTVFVRFRGADTRSVDISIHTVPSSWTNARGEVRDYTNFATLESDWAIGAIEPEDFPEDPDGADFGYRSTLKMLMALVRRPSEGVAVGSQYEDPTLARSFDYQWSRNGVTITPTYPGAETGFPFLFLQAGDITATDTTTVDPGRSAQFLCNVIQL